MALNSTSEPGSHLPDGQLSDIASLSSQSGNGALVGAGDGSGDGSGVGLGVEDGVGDGVGSGLALFVTWQLSVLLMSQGGSLRVALTPYFCVSPMGGQGTS